MREALLLAARAAELGEVPVGAVVVSGDEIIGRGHNCSIIEHDATGSRGGQRTACGWPAALAIIDYPALRFMSRLNRA